MPAGTPADDRRRSSTPASTRCCASPTSSRGSKPLNVDFRENTPDEFRAFVTAEMEKWARVIEEANIKLG